MPHQPSPLAAHLAQHRSNGPSGPVRGRLPISLHALIAAIFARIFDRLEQLLQLWQSGTLPVPPVRQPTHRHLASKTRAPCRRTARAPRVRAHQTYVRAARTGAAIHMLVLLAPSKPSATPSPPPRHAHDPPGRPKNPIFD